MWAKIFLILAMHGSATFDAWSTNRQINSAAPGRRGVEHNPLLRPFAGKPSMYIAVNLPLVAVDIWMLKRPKSRLPMIVAGSLVASSTTFGIRNALSYNDGWRRFNAWKSSYCAELPHRWSGCTENQMGGRGGVRYGP